MYKQNGKIHWLTNSKKFFITRKFFITAMLFSLLVLPFSSAFADTASDPDHINEIKNILEQYHVSGATDEQLSKSAIDGMINGLNDPYTKYFTKEEYDQFISSLERNYVGIGIRVGIDEEGFFVQEVFSGSPAEEMGLKRGDYLLAVEGISMKGKTLEELVNSIIGKEQTTVKVTVKSGTVQKDIVFNRKRITLPAVTSKIIDHVGYLQLSTFSSDADSAFTEQLDELKAQGMKSLIIDLRNNGGGLLDTATNIAKLFIQKGVMIHAINRDKVDSPINITDGSSLDIPVYVLVNQDSASASEVLTGALQDYKLATVIGTNTFGKGSVQNIFPITGGGMLKVTIDEYFTPNMRKVNKVGLKPDIEVFGDAAQLITALRTAGVDSLHIDQDAFNVHINQEDFLDTFKVIRENDKVYVPSRFLAAAVGGTLNWNSAAQAVTITQGNHKESFSNTNSTIRLIKGTNYIDLAYFHSLFPQLTWQTNGEHLMIDVSKGN